MTRFLFMLLIQLWQVDGYEMPSSIPFSLIWQNDALTFVEKNKFINIEHLYMWNFGGMAL
jgi:hypothetical protein